MTSHFYKRIFFLKKSNFCLASISLVFIDNCMILHQNISNQSKNTSENRAPRHCDFFFKYSVHVGRRPPRGGPSPYPAGRPSASLHTVLQKKTRNASGMFGWCKWLTFIKYIKNVKEKWKSFYHLLMIAWLWNMKYSILTIHVWCNVKTCQIFRFSDFQIFILSDFQIFIFSDFQIFKK